MKKLPLLLLILSIWGVTDLMAFPNSFTYQGKLQERGASVDGTKTMRFRLTDANGTTEYWSSGDMQVQVRNGLFSVILPPPGRPFNVAWQDKNPYIEVSIGTGGGATQTLSPREPVTSNIYSLFSADIADGKITPAKLSPETKLMTIPSGMISMFATSCPAGWNRVTALDGRFPKGSNTYGETGGESATDGRVSGVQKTTSFVTTNAPPLGVGTEEYMEDLGSASFGKRYGKHTHTVPYVNVVFCQKS